MMLTQVCDRVLRTSVCETLGKTLQVGERQWSLACGSPRGCKESDTTERLNSSSYATVSQSLTRGSAL